MRPRRVIWAALAAAAVLLSCPAGALGHAVLEETVPERGEDVTSAPPAVELHFNEPIEASFGSVRVYASDGQVLGGTEIFRPGDQSDSIGARLPGGLADGTYTVTYRVISADSHPVAGGFVFSVGDPGSAPAESVSQLLVGGDAGPVTQAAGGVARGVSYLATAVVVGGLLFGMFVFGPAARDALGAASPRNAASIAFSKKLRELVLAAAVAGLIAGATGIVAQGAIAGGTSAWQAVDSSTIGDVLDTRFGMVWGLRELAWLVIAVAALVAGIWLTRPRTLALLALPIAALAFTPALAGHASTFAPSWLLVSSTAIHVVSMSAWVGGIAMLVIALRSATRALDASESTRLLSASLARFSPVALGAVLALLISGSIQSIAYIDRVSDFWETGFGRAIAVKIVVIACLVSIGVLHRRRSLPRLRAAAKAGKAPGSAGTLVRTALLAEVGFFIVALTATSFLVAQAPPGSLAAGPQTGSASIGDADLEAVVDPAALGANEIHLYLFAKDDGSQYDELRRVSLTATQPDADIGPIPIDLEKTGPGHFTAPNAQFGATGTWELELEGQVSKFEAVTGAAEVEVR